VPEFKLVEQPLQQQRGAPALDVFVAWILRKLGELQTHTNEVSDVRLGAWWRISLVAITPVALGVMLVFNLYTNITQNYEQYPTDFLLSYGWAIAVATLIIGALVSLKRWDDSVQLSRPTEV
jgi:neurotransmitter:Na+ symporter, NSS family